MRSHPYRALNYAHSADERGRLSILIAAPIISQSLATSPSSLCPAAAGNDRQASYFCGQVYNTLRRHALCEGAAAAPIHTRCVAGFGDRFC